MGRLPTDADFSAKVKLTIVPPRKGDFPTNVLILLHGLGDSHDSFTSLGKQMNLPETACVSIRGPQTLLDLGGFHWGDDIFFNSSFGGLDADAGFKQSNEFLKSIVQEVLVEKCGYNLREIIFFGFGQGGMAALSAAANLYQSAPAAASAELGGVISVGGALPGDVPASLNPKNKAPVLVCAGSDASSVTSSSEEKLRHVFETVEIKRYRKSGDSMPSSRDEMMPIMQFFSRRLKSTKGIPEGSVEVCMQHRYAKEVDEDDISWLPHGIPQESSTK